MSDRSCGNLAVIGSDVYYSCEGGEEVSYRDVLERLSLTDRTTQQMFVEEAIDGVSLFRVKTFAGKALR